MQDDGQHGSETFWATTEMVFDGVPARWVCCGLAGPTVYLTVMLCMN